jgi:hypothetical protein
MRDLGTDHSSHILTKLPHNLQCKNQNLVFSIQIVKITDKHNIRGDIDTKRSAFQDIGKEARRYYWLVSGSANSLIISDAGPVE